MSKKKGKHINNNVEELSYEEDESNEDFVEQTEELITDI